MAERLPPLPRDQLPESQQSAYDDLQKEASATFGPRDQSPFVYQREDGAFVGPFPLFLASPDAGAKFMSIFGTLGKIPGLPPDAKEAVILAVGAKYQSGYELYAHGNVAVKKAGLSQEIVDQISSGRKPSTLNEQCSLSYDAARYLVDTPGKLSQELWDSCVSMFGKEGTVALVHYVGAYAYTCIVLNAMDAPVPNE